MRDIKFRTWYYHPSYKLIDGKYEGKWMMAEVKSLHVGTGKVMVGDKLFSGNRTLKIGNKCKVMQYTGLKDKNDKEIYEGDIVFLPNTPNQYKCVVVYDEKQAKFKLSPITAYLQNAGKGSWTGYDFSMIMRVVIGNIYENPELLKGE